MEFSLIETTNASSNVRIRRDPRARVRGEAELVGLGRKPSWVK
jgi:hypothetical protein